MSDQQPKILVIEDELDVLEFYIVTFEEAHYDVYPAQTVEEARAHLQTTEFDVVLVDLMLQFGDRDGITILREVKAKSPLTQVIIVTGIGGTEDAKQAQQLKTDGYLTKPVKEEELLFAVHNAVEWRKQRIKFRDRPRRQPQKEQGILDDITPEQFVYACEMMKEVALKVIQLAKQDTHLLIVGEAGTGKGLLAEGIHNGSKRKTFELVNCGSLSETTLERILFGYLDEHSDNPGILARLSGGTLVLDNISNLSLRLQERLLNALLAGEYQPHESASPITIDIRVIAIDESDLRTAVQQNLFLPALYDLLVQEVCLVPPLRERRDDSYKDVVVIATHFVEKYGSATQRKIKLSSQVEYIFEHYPFPGNVRELQKAIRLALDKLNGSNLIGPEHLPTRMRRYEIQPGLGVVEEAGRVLCPHGDFYCNQTALIAATHKAARGVYLRLQTSELEEVIHSTIKRLNIPLIAVENVQNPLTSICEVCAAIQSSHYAIVEITGVSGLFYELGMLHALGIPTLILCAQERRLPPQFGMSAVTYYTDASEIQGIAERWLADLQ